MGDTRAWRIDTLDARGGLAFATWREAITAIPEAAIDDKPCFFVGAPDFRAQPVANRAIALAAGRGTFQTGLFAGNTEISFPSPDALVEFVRRTYVGSGAGDGTDGGGGGNATPETRRPDGPDLPNPPHDMSEVEGEDLLRRIHESIERFHELAHKLKPGEAERQKWPEIGGHPERFRDAPRILCVGALYLIGEVLRRFPNRWNVVDLLRWQAMAQSVGRLLTQLDLWPLLLRDPCWQFTAKLVDAFVRQSHVPAVQAIHKETAADFVLWMLFFGGDLYTESDALRFAHYVHHTPFVPFIVPTRNGERSLDLCQTPLPIDFDKYVPHDLVGRASLFHALAAFIAAPHRKPHHGFVELLLLAASYIAHKQEDRMALLPWPWGQRHPSPLAEARVATHAKKGWDWIREQMPGLVYEQSTESLIGSAATLRYPRTQLVPA